MKLQLEHFDEQMALMQNDKLNVDKSLKANQALLMQ